MTERRPRAIAGSGLNTFLDILNCMHDCMAKGAGCIAAEVEFRCQDISNTLWGVCSSCHGMCMEGMKIDGVHYFDHDQPLHILHRPCQSYCLHCP